MLPYSWLLYLLLRVIAVLGLILPFIPIRKTMHLYRLLLLAIMSRVKKSTTGRGGASPSTVDASRARSDANQFV